MKVRAAAYMRMSTSEQINSIENQLSFIMDYATVNNMLIVKEYRDSGKSALTFKDRPAMQQLLSDIFNQKADFQIILVYDMSRWSRAQNTKESIVNQYLCEKNGVRLICCQGNGPKYDNYEDNLGAEVGEMFDRHAAAHFSKSLSLRVFRGQCHLIKQGYRQGGPAGFGLRRVLIDENGVEKLTLKRGEWKSIQTDRVILRPGPDKEIEIVNQIYQWFIEDNKTEQQIAHLLNTQGIRTDLDRPWTRSTVYQILINEKYIGNNVFNRSSSRLKTPRKLNPFEQWVRKNNAFKAIVPLELFMKAQQIRLNRSQKITKEQMLKLLKILLSSKGTLSGLLIDEQDNMPSSSTYRVQFGSLLKAYTLIGFNPERDYRYIEINKKLRVFHHQLLNQIIDNMEQHGAEIKLCNNQLIHANHEISISIIISRCIVKSPYRTQWLFRFESSLNPDITVAVRMQPDNHHVLDYYIFPHQNFSEESLKINSNDQSGLDVYQFKSLDFLYTLVARVPLAGVN